MHSSVKSRHPWYRCSPKYVNISTVHIEQIGFSHFSNWQANNRLCNFMHLFKQGCATYLGQFFERNPLKCVPFFMQKSLTMGLIFKLFLGSPCKPQKFLKICSSQFHFFSLNCWYFYIYRDPRKLCTNIISSKSVLQKWQNCCARELKYWVPFSYTNSEEQFSRN